MRGPIVAILLAFILAFRVTSIFALKKFNFQVGAAAQELGGSWGRKGGQQSGCFLVVQGCTLGPAEGWALAQPCRRHVAALTPPCLLHAPAAPRPMLSPWVPCHPHPPSPAHLQNR